MHLAERLAPGGDDFAPEQVIQSHDRAGANYGWHTKEGTFAFDPGSPNSPDDGTLIRNSPHQPAGLTDPIAEYDHTGPHGTINGEAAVGGFVYHGRSIPELAGR